MMTGMAWGEVALRTVRAIGVGGTAAMALLLVAGAIAVGLVEPDGMDGLSQPSDTDGLAIGLGHFEATLNWFTFLGGALWGFATPVWRHSPRMRVAGTAMVGVGATMIAFMVYYALDDAIYWDGSGDPNMRPWFTVGIALLLGAAASAGYWLKSRPAQPSPLASASA